MACRRQHSHLSFMLFFHLSSFDWTNCWRVSNFPPWWKWSGRPINKYAPQAHRQRQHRTRAIFRTENGEVSAVAVSFLYCLRIEWKNKNKLNKLQFEMYWAVFMRLCIHCTALQTTHRQIVGMRLPACLPNRSVCCVQINRRRENTYLQIIRFTIWI